MNQIDPIFSAGPSNQLVQSTLFGGAEEKPVAGSNGVRKGRRRASVAKNYVLDTNVLLHDPHCIHRFADNHVWIPVDVLSELDRFKNEPSERGANARAVHRTLTQLFSLDPKRSTSGIPTPGGGTIRLAIYDPESKGRGSVACAKFRRIFPDQTRVDHRILACVLRMDEELAEGAVLVSKDLNMQLKALAVGLSCEDYLNDKVAAKEVEGYELRRIEVHPHELQRFASSSELPLEGARVAGLVTNEYVLLAADDKKTMPARYHQDGVLRRLHMPDALHMPRGVSLKPLNLGQQCLLDALLDPDISLVTCFGQAGTGKTLLAVAAGLHMVFDKLYHGMTVSRPVVAMGDTLGYLPGDLDEKMRPWLQPIYDAFDLLMPPGGVPSDPQHGNKKQAKKQKRHEHDHGHHHPGPPPAHLIPRKPWEMLIDQGLVEIEALCYIRGRSIPRRFFVLDEAQQLTPLEAKTVITRMSRGSKLVMIGDPAQIDNPYVDSRSNGLVYTRTRMRGEPITAHVSLSKGERSQLAEIGARLM